MEKTILAGPCRTFVNRAGLAPPPPLAVLAPRDGSHPPPDAALWRDATTFDAARFVRTAGDGRPPAEDPRAAPVPPPRPSLAAPGDAARWWTMDGGNRATLLKYVALPDAERRQQLLDALSAPLPTAAAAVA